MSLKLLLTIIAIPEVAPALLKEFLEDRQHVRHKVGVKVPTKVTLAHVSKNAIKGRVASNRIMKSSRSGDDSSDSSEEEEILRKPRASRRQKSISF